MSMMSRETRQTDWRRRAEKAEARVHLLAAALQEAAEEHHQTHHAGIYLHACGDFGCQRNMARLTEVTE